MGKINIQKKRKKKKQRDQKKKEKIQNYQNKINKYNQLLWCPKSNSKYEKINKGSCFDISKSTSVTINKLEIEKDLDIKNNITYFSCKKVFMELNTDQKELMQRWFKSYTLMYNATLNYIRKTKKETGKLVINFRSLRSKLKTQKDQIIMSSHLENKKKVKSHILDYAIKLACTNYKSALTNFKRGNIKHFRIRNWRINRDRNIMDIENCYFKEKGMCVSAFGKIKYTYNNVDFDISSVNKTCKIGYSNKNYYLYVPEEKNCPNTKNEKKIFSGDPGIRTFLSGISENEEIKIGDKFNEKIKKELLRIDDLKKRKVPAKIIKKNEFQSNKRIINLVDELHWKTIKYLTDNYNIILIGNLSVKGISNRNSSNLQKITKRIGYRMKHYCFRQRLKYKCDSKNLHFYEVDESYTSKICSKCGYLKENLGGSRTFKCDNCKLEIDRDINGARGIFQKWI